MAPSVMKSSKKSESTQAKRTIKSIARKVNILQKHAKVERLKETLLYIDVFSYNLLIYALFLCCLCFYIGLCCLYFYIGVINVCS